MSGESWSATKIGSFENCPKQFEFRYRQGMYEVPGTPEGVESLLGVLVHQVLEDLFRSLPIKPGDDTWTPEKARDRFLALWDARLADTSRPVLVVKKNRTLESYRADGARAVETFCRKWYPFDKDRTVQLEFSVRFEYPPVAPPSSVTTQPVIVRRRISGVIDRLAEEPDGTLVVHDYKTKGRLPTDQEVRSSLQAAIYHEGLRQARPNAKIKLIWHHLLFGLETVFETPLITMEEVIQRIERIAAAREFPPEKSPLCSWCQFQGICPAWQQPA